MKILAASLLFSCARFIFAVEVPNEQDRLIATGRLWLTVKYFHPLLAYRKDIDWDKALVDALPKIRAAKTVDEYSAAVQAILKALPELNQPEVKQPAAGPPRDASAHRTWVHYGLNRSAFSIEPGPSRESITVDMGGGVTAPVPLSEPFSANLPAWPDPPPDRSYSESPYPSTEYRILAAYKLWGVVRNFFAYRDLMDDDWDEDFSQFLPKFIAAKDVREYNLAVAEAVTHLDDSNAIVASSEIDKYFGPAAPGMRLRLFDKKPVITEITDDAASSGGVSVGDIVTRVDDEDIVARINREAGYISGSTQQALGNSVMQRILNGPTGSEAVLTVRTHDGATKEIRLKRVPPGPEAPPKGDAFKLLSSRFGYVDLSRIKADQVTAIFEKFAATPAIIFDARGPVSFDPAAFASHFTDKSDVAGAIVTGPVSLKPDVAGPKLVTETATFFRVEAVPPGAGTIYRGKTVMLIDERTIGAAEHLGLLLEAANKTAFIGSLSAGADAEIANFVVPGGITISFSASDIRHGNSGKLQRVGLQPTESVAPSLAYIRSGRDAILEKAIEYLSH